MWKTKVRANLYFKLATLIEAGIPLLRGLEVAGQGYQPRVRKALKGVRRQLEGGATLSEAMEGDKGLFAGFDRTLVSAAETAGMLDECFKGLADWYQFLWRARNTVIMGLAYPLVILHMAAVVPGLPALILGQVDEWGFVRQCLSTLALFYVPAGLILGALAVMPKEGPLRRVLDEVLIRVPVLGTAVRELSIARFARAFNLLYKAGVPICECFAKAPQVTGNLAVAAVFQRGAKAVAAGREASEGLQGGLPSEYLELWQVGQESGRLDQTVDKIAEIASERAHLWLMQLARWLPWIVYAWVMVIMVMQILSLAGQVGGAYQGLM